MRDKGQTRGLHTSTSWFFRLKRPGCCPWASPMGLNGTAVWLERHRGAIFFKYALKERPARNRMSGPAPPMPHLTEKALETRPLRFSFVYIKKDLPPRPKERRQELKTMKIKTNCFRDATDGPLRPYATSRSHARRRALCSASRDSRAASCCQCLFALRFRSSRSHTASA